MANHEGSYMYMIYNKHKFVVKNISNIIKIQLVLYVKIGDNLKLDNTSQYHFIGHKSQNIILLNCTRTIENKMVCHFIERNTYCIHHAIIMAAHPWNKKKKKKYNNIACVKA